MAKLNRNHPKKASLDKGDLSLLKLGPRHFPMKENSKKLNNTDDFTFFLQSKRANFNESWYKIFYHDGNKGPCITLDMLAYIFL